MEKTWLKRYPPGVPAEIGPVSGSLGDLFEQSVAAYADRTAFLSMGRSLSYAELGRLARDFAAYLRSIGIAPGARIALMLPNILQYPVGLFGALRAGCIVVACNPLYTPRELEHQLKDSGAEAIVVLENFAHVLAEVIGRTAVRHVVVTSVGDLLGPVKGACVDFAIRHVKRKVPSYRLPGAVRFKAAMAAGAGLPLEPPTVRPEDVALLQYTGGTTGLSKGAMLTHGNLLSNLAQAHAWIAPFLRQEGELIVTALPLYHVFALTANCLTFLKVGAANLLIANPRDIPGFVKTLARHRFTAITGVNTLFNALLDDPGFSGLDFSGLHISLGGGMAVQQGVAERWQRATGCPIVEAYGLTETSPAVTINPLDIHAWNGTVGLPVPSTEIAIRDGELCVRGPQVMKGYWNQPAETAAAFTPDGFLKTGDVATIDEAGFVRIVDRRKDMILVSGFSVYPSEVEGVAAMHPGVLEAAAIGVPDAGSGEAVRLFAVRRDSGLTADELAEHCRRNLTAYKRPREIVFREALPKTPVGKVLRRALREESAAQS